MSFWLFRVLVVSKLCFVFAAVSDLHPSPSATEASVFVGWPNSPVFFVGKYLYSKPRSHCVLITLYSVICFYLQFGCCGSFRSVGFVGQLLCLPIFPGLHNLLLERVLFSSFSFILLVLISMFCRFCFAVIKSRATSR